MAYVKWIKLVTNVFDNRKIRQIEMMPDGDSIVVIWFKLLCLAGNINDRGMVYFTNEIPYTEQMLATQFGRPLTTVQLALRTFEQFAMIEVIDNIIHISSWEKYQNVDGMERIKEQNRLRKAAQRERQKLLAMSRDSHGTVTQCHAIDKEEDKEERNKNNNNISSESSSKPVKHKYGEYKNVLLTDSELEKIKAEYPDWEDRIERLSSYVASTGKRYKSHYATIRNWARKEGVKDEKHARPDDHITGKVGTWL